MIEIVPKEIDNFINYLNKKYPIRKKIKLTILPPNMFEIPLIDSGCAYGFFIENKIIVNTTSFYKRKHYKYQLMLFIAHEYKHAIQYNTHKDFEKIYNKNPKFYEDEADDFAYNAVFEFTDGKVRRDKYETEKEKENEKNY